jgi:23S rRNA (guanosine2251-2'-O)-methyltransferase
MARSSSNADESRIIGRNPVREALEGAGEVGIEKVMLQHGAGGEGIAAIRQAAEARGVPVQYVPPRRLKHEARGGVHQGVVAIAAPFRYRAPDALLSEIAPTWDDVRAAKPLLLVLDRITDPRNYGAILRSAVAAGVDGVFVPATHMAPLSAVAVKASAGTAPRVPIARTTDLVTFCQSLKERGYYVVGADGAAEQSVWATDFDRPVAVVIGSEGQGMRLDVAAVCDERVAIPMRGPAESLNASVAAGILLLTAARPRL